MQQDSSDISIVMNETSPGSNRSKAILALLLLVPIPSIGVLMGMGDEVGMIGKAVFAFSKVWILVLPVVWYLWIEKRKLKFPKWSWNGIATGTFLGVLISAAILGAYSWFGSGLVDTDTVRATATRTGLTNIPFFIGFFIYMCLINALLEEYVWRWFVFQKCREIVPQFKGWLAVLLSALLFTIHHVVALRFQMDWTPTLLASAGVFAGGVAWSWCYLKYNTVWPGYVSHVFADAAIVILAWQLIYS